MFVAEKALTWLSVLHDPEVNTTYSAATINSSGLKITFEAKEKTL